MGYSPPGSSVHGILQARILEWVYIPFSRGSFWPRDWTWVYCTAGKFFTIWGTRKINNLFCLYIYNKFPKHKHALNLSMHSLTEYIVDWIRFCSKPVFSYDFLIYKMETKYFKTPSYWMIIIDPNYKDMWQNESWQAYWDLRMHP